MFAPAQRARGPTSYAPPSGLQQAQQAQRYLPGYQGYQQPWMFGQVPNVSVHSSSSQSVLVPQSPQAVASGQENAPRANEQRGDSVSRQVSMPTKMVPAPEARLAPQPQQQMQRGIVHEQSRAHLR